MGCVKYAWRHFAQGVTFAHIVNFERQWKIKEIVLIKIENWPKVRVKGNNNSKTINKYENRQTNHY